MSFNFVSKNISAPSEYGANLSGAFVGDFDGDGSDLANVSHIEQSHQGGIEDFRLVFFSNTTSSLSNERTIRGHAHLRYSPTDQEFEIGTDKVKLTSIPTASNTVVPSHLLTLDSSNRLIKTDFNIAQGGAGQFQYYGSNGALTASSNLRFDGNVFYVQTGLVHNRTQYTTSSYIALSDYYIAVSNSSGADIVLTLPSASLLTSGQTFIVKDEAGNALQHSIIISASTGETIDSRNNVIIESPHGALNIYSDGDSKFFVY